MLFCSIYFLSLRVATSEWWSEKCSKNGGGGALVPSHVIRFYQIGVLSVTQFQPTFRDAPSTLQFCLSKRLE